MLMVLIVVFIFKIPFLSYVFKYKTSLFTCQHLFLIIFAWLIALLGLNNIRTMINCNNFSKNNSKLAHLNKARVRE
jgi:hypothetical protein